MNCLDIVEIHKDVQPHIFDSNLMMISDPPELIGGWGRDICVTAKWMNFRALVFSRDSKFLVSPCCIFLHPLGFSDDYTLVNYSPVTTHQVIKGSKGFRYAVDLIASPKLDIAPFENNLAIVIVDVKMGRLLLSGLATKVIDSNPGSLRIEVDVSVSSGVNYTEFMDMIVGKPLEREIPALQDYTEQAIEQSMDNGFVRIY